MNTTSIREDVGSILGPTQWVKDSSIAVNCGVSWRCSLDLALLWLWCRAEATALIQPFAWDLPYAMGMAKKKKTKKPTARMVIKQGNLWLDLNHFHYPTLQQCKVLGKKKQNFNCNSLALPSRQAVTQSKWVSFLRLTSQGLIFCSHLPQITVLRHASGTIFTQAWMHGSH